MGNEKTDYIQEIGGMIEKMQSLVKEAVIDIEPQVDRIIRKRSTDNRHIETLLDRLLDYAGVDYTGLALFKRLCRYYYSINPKVTADYVYAYRDLYDSETNEE